MPFPVRAAAAVAQSSQTPALGAAPTPPAAPGATPAPPAPPAPQGEPRFYVAIAGQSVLMPKSEAEKQNPNLPCMTEDQKSGWQTVAVLLPMANPMRPGGTQPGGFAARAGQPQQGVGQSVGTPANLYAGVENAEVYRKGALFTEGEYIAKVARAEYIQGRQKNMVLVELEITTSSYNKDVPATHGALREGTHATAFIIKNDNFLSNIKEVVLACSGFDAAGNWRKEDDVVTAEECTALTAPEQAFAGAMVYLEAKMTKTRAGGDYTRLNWWPCPMKADGTPDTDKLFSQVRV